MDYQERVKVYDRIIGGYKLIEDRGTIYRCRDPLSFHRQLTDLYIDQLDLEDVMSDDMANAILKRKNVWSDREEKLLASLTEEMKQANDELSKATFKSITKQKLTTKIKGLKQRIARLERNKYSLRGVTREDLINEIRYRHYVFLLTETLDGHRVWTDFADFEQASDRLIKKLIRHAYTSGDITETAIREIARTEPWRSVWVSGVKVGNLFPFAQSDMTDYQRVLVSWSLIYDSAYESMEPPDDSVVDDDALFDLWLEARSADRKAKKNKSTAEKTSGSMNKYSDVAIPVESAEDAQKVYNLNDPLVKAKIANQQKFIEERGSASELELPGVKKELQMRLVGAHAEKLKGRS